MPGILAGPETFFDCLPSQIKKMPKSLNGNNFTLLLQPQIESSFFIRRNFSEGGFGIWEFR